MPAKQYGDIRNYENKLSRVMERLGAALSDYNWDRAGAWVEFRYKDQLYRFDHSVDNARAHGVNLTYGSDAFSQIVLSLEDLARMIERGIYDLSTWVAGMRYLPPPPSVLPCFKVMGFTERPLDPEVVRSRFRELVKIRHPDQGGTEAEFNELNHAYKKALETYEDKVSAQ
jgi:hypothetical protein